MAQFANGERGAILVPSLSKYCFQDAAKTTRAVVGGAVVKIVCPATGVEATFANVTLQQDSAGRKYLAANGTSSSGTASLDLSGTDAITATVGLHKASDAAAGAAFEFTANSSVNAGSFGLFAPISASADFQYRSLGSTIATAATAVGPYPAPLTAVVTTASDISADSAILRVNGAQAASSVADQGTGNYANSTLNLFSRAAAAFWFNGRFYGGMWRGVLSNAGQIADAERYVNSLTGAY
jgi:hypothetical protein